MASVAPLCQQSGKDFLPLKGAGHVEFYVGNARQAASYYRTAFRMRLVACTGRIGLIEEPMEERARLGIPPDRGDEAGMPQIFTRPVEDRPTLFYETIQRHGPRSSGKANSRAIFEAIEREPALGGNL